MGSEEEVSVKDIVNFYIKINDSSKVKNDLARLSSKDRLTALEVISGSGAVREFKIDVARYFLYDTDARLRKKAELMMESLVPDWVSDPAESILRLFKGGDAKGISRRNEAVRFLFGIVDAVSLRETFYTLLSSRNRQHMAEIVAVLEEYIDASRDEREQVRIFDACLDIVMSDDSDHNLKHYASSLLSVFFKKVQATSLGEALHRKYVERQTEKGEAVYRYLCGGSAWLTSACLDDLLGPLEAGGGGYQVKVLSYFCYVMSRIRHQDEMDSVLDMFAGSWGREELDREELRAEVSRRIITAVDQLWDKAADAGVRDLIVRVRYCEYSDKRELLEQIRMRLGQGDPAPAAREKIIRLLGCFLLPEEDDALKLQVTHLLLFTLGCSESRERALGHLKYYVETRNLNYAEKGSIAAVVESLLRGKTLGPSERETAGYILFVAAPERVTGSGEQMNLLEYLRKIVDGNGFEYPEAEGRVIEALHRLVPPEPCRESFAAAVRRLEARLRP